MPAPKIESVFPLSNITPNGSVLVKGCGFGRSPGQFVLVLSQSGQEVPLTSLQWSENGVAGILPGTDHHILKHAKTQSAILQVKQPIGTGTSAFITYRAGRIVKQYPFHLLSTVVSTESDDDRCVEIWEGRGMCSNYTGPWDPTGGDRGQDTFSVSLKNGWNLDSWVFTRADGSIDKGILPHTTHTGAGQAHANEEVDWLVTCGDGCTCLYYIDIFVEGEIGTTWN